MAKKKAKEGKEGLKIRKCDRKEKEKRDRTVTTRIYKRIKAQKNSSYR